MVISSFSSKLDTEIAEVEHGDHGEVRMVCVPQNRKPSISSVLSVCSVVTLLMFLLPHSALALSIMYPGEGIKTVVSKTGEEIKKVLDADNDASRAAKGVVALVDPNTWAGYFDQFDMDLTVSGYHNTIDGNRTRSFLKPGTQTQEQANIGGKKRYANFGGGDFEFKSAIRSTDDRQVDAVKRTRLQSLYGTFSRPDDYSLRLGNVSGSFTSYSLSSSANVGAHLTKELGGKNMFKELQFYFARPTRHLEGTSFQRLVVGARLADMKIEGWDELQKLGLSYVKTKDIVDSIKDTSARPANAVENQVVSADASFKFGGDATVQAEWAYSKTDPNTQASLADVIHGAAYKLNGSYRAKPRLGFDATSVTTSFEEVDPDYRSTSGGGSPDARRVTLGLNSGMKLYGNAPDVTMSYSGNSSRNNLENQIARRTTSTVHNFNFSFKPYQKTKPVTDELWNNMRKNTSVSTAFGQNITKASDNSTKSAINNQNYQLSTSSGRHTLSTFYRYQITQEKTAATGDRRNASNGFTYGLKEIKWKTFLYPQKPFGTDMTLNATRTRDKSIDVAGRSHQRQYGVSTQTKVNDEERLDVDYNLNLTDNYNENSDLRTMNWKCAYVVQKFIQEDGSFTLSYSSNKTEEELMTQNYREAVWRADANLKWGGPAPEIVAARDAAEAAVKEILNVYAEEDILKFMQLVSKNFKGDRIAFENQVRALYDRVDTIKYEGVWASTFVPGDNVLEITFRWQRRWRVYATGAEETAAGIALFRLEKAGNQWLLQEIRETSPLF
ncbi:MAG: hypothetical protein A3G34_07550 [Candidatus Lindowbacteria bacterium RIFCSPLOWO2_12_FULL_62_27]|nr:MAG: hypothetical protein A3I06_06285 [Candidatus Lindowbacteria bacterium RIFCSPLOWO2_02_FULL_62_12]OGH59665.1 MAG: hypothetical protein A3G34_07550 [Candidatus Lindowbacteria bacterium RIFCSPLOWO2_12_FULL_62_27]